MLLKANCDPLPTSLIQNMFFLTNCTFVLPIQVRPELIKGYIDYSSDPNVWHILIISSWSLFLLHGTELTAQIYTWSGFIHDSKTYKQTATLLKAIAPSQTWHRFNRFQRWRLCLLERDPGAVFDVQQNQHLLNLPTYLPK
jgi:hypothetical protein